jgi:Glycosyltransferase family 87
VLTWVCFCGWGARAARSYLLLSLPLAPLLYYHYDLLGAACALGGLLLVARQRPGAGGVAWVAGAFLKLWPVVFVPRLLRARQPRAFVGAVALGIAGLFAWLLWGGLDGPGQVLTYRGAKGWEFESAPASLLRLLTRGELRFEQGAMRVGAPPRVLGMMLAFALIGIILATWRRAFMNGAPDGIPEVVVVGSSLLLSTLFSAQFMIWLVPFVAIAAAHGVERIQRWAALASAATFAYWWLYDPRHPGAMNVEAAIAIRNLAVVGVVVVAVRALVSVPQRRPPRALEAVGV